MSLIKFPDHGDCIFTAQDARDIAIQLDAIGGADHIKALDEVKRWSDAPRRTGHGAYYRVLQASSDRRDAKAEMFLFQTPMPRRELGMTMKTYTGS